MNLFKKYGIKEVADVVFYSITQVGDEEFYTPVLVLDTLKVSTIEKSAEKVSASGGKGNKKLITWNFGKELSLNLTDALFSPASMSLVWGGKLNAKMSDYSSIMVKTSIANKYGVLHYSTKAYPSPALTDMEWEIIFKAATEAQVPSGRAAKQGEPENANCIYWAEGDISDLKYIQENRTILRRRYFNRTWSTDYMQTYGNVDIKSGDKYPAPFSNTEFQNKKVQNFITNKEYGTWFYGQSALPDIITVTVLGYINKIDDIGTLDTQIYDTEVVDRMEKCIVKDRYGLTISTAEQKKNLMRFYRNDTTESYIIYYDAKTMLPLLNLTENGFIKGWDAENKEIWDRDFDRKTDVDEFKLKPGTVYYKWTRTVKKKAGNDDSILGKTFVIDADTFPDTYKIVGETYIREQKTNKDQRYQFIIHRAQVSSDTSITLEAEGDPTTFEMQIDVLTPPNDIQMELKQIDVEEDAVNGGTRVVPQSNHYTYTSVDYVENNNIGFTNGEIY